MIEVRAFVNELCMLGKYQESMCESLRDKELFLVLSGKYNAEPFSVCLGTFTKVNCYVEYFTVYNTYQFVLREVDLEMKSAKNSFVSSCNKRNRNELPAGTHSCRTEPERICFSAVSFQDLPPFPGMFCV